jgi:splicing factor 3A subunit 3
MITRVTHRRDYLGSLLAYLLSFYERTQPLSQVAKQLAKLQAEVEAAWPEGQVSAGLSWVCIG